MLALGTFLICCAVLGIALAALLFRRPDPPRWTTRSWSDDAVAIALVCVLPLGLGYLGAGSINAYQQGVSGIDLGLLAAAIVLAAVAWRQLGVRERWRAMAADTGGPAAVPGAADAAVTAAEAIGKRPPSGPADRAA